MTIDPSKLENAGKGCPARNLASSPDGSAESGPMLKEPVIFPQERESRAARGGAARVQVEGCAADLNREAANMLELQSRQSMGVTPLSISSQAAQTVMKQF